MRTVFVKMNFGELIDIVDRFQINRVWKFTIFTFSLYKNSLHRTFTKFIISAVEFKNK